MQQFSNLELCTFIFDLNIMDYIHWTIKQTDLLLAAAG